MTPADVIAAYRERCDDDCPGWVIECDTLAIERCDECAHLNGVERTLSDDDVAGIPAAQAAQAAAHDEAPFWGES